MTEKESVASEGLDVSDHFKWKQAKILAANKTTEDSRLLPYWERVRMIFLEFGGGCLPEDK